MKKLSVILLTLAGCLGSSAQCISMQEAIRIAQDSAITAYASQNALIRSEWEYKQFMATRKPQLAFELTPGYQKFTNDPTLNYYKLRNYNMMNTYGEFRLEQEALGIGGSFYANTGALWTEYFGSNPEQRVFSSIPIGVGYSNDLIGYNPHKWEKAIHDFHIESEKKSHRFELCSIASEAEKYYIACLVANENYEISLVNSDVTGEALEIGKEKFAIASITKNELFALELQHVNAENTVFDTKRALDNARKDLFSFLQIDDAGQTLTIPEMPAFILIDTDETLRIAKENNPSCRNSQEEIIKAQQRLAKAKVESSFLQTAMDLNLGVQSNDSNFAASYSNQKLFFVGGITLRIPIIDGGLAKSRAKAAEYNLKHTEYMAEEEARKLEVNVKTAIKDFVAQQDLLQRTSAAIELADESFNLARELYGNGDIDINTFILALNRKDDSYKNYLKSLQSYWDSRYTLRKLCVILDGEN